MALTLNQQTTNKNVIFNTIEAKIEELNEVKKASLHAADTKAIELQHSKGKLTARERIDLLLDPGTFEEIGAFVKHQCSNFGLDKRKYLGDSVVTGYGLINGRKTFVYAQDFTILGGTISLASAEKICKILDLAANTGCPVVGLLDSGGARIQEGVDALVGCGEIFTRNTLYSGVIPQISVITGPCAGAAVYSPALTDFIFMVQKTGQMYVTGPSVVQAVTGEKCTAEDTGSADIHARKSGNCHFVFDDEFTCFQMVRKLLSFLPQNNKQKSRILNTNDPQQDKDEILNVVPAEPYKTYDMKRIIGCIVDDSDFMEVHELFAQNVITGFARLGGYSIGIVAQQPLHLAGALTADASDKAARFIRFCDCFNIPIVTLVDVPGYMPGVDQERQGIIRHGAKLLYAYVEATVPKISVIIRKAYGGAYIAMSSKSLRGDINFAWPTGEIAVMGPEGAVNILFKEEINSSNNPEEITEALVEQYRKKFANPYLAAEKGYIDEVIHPKETRIKLIKALKILEDKSVVLPFKKHGNIPL